MNFNHSLHIRIRLDLMFVPGCALIVALFMTSSSCTADLQFDVPEIMFLGLVDSSKAWPQTLCE